MEFHFWSRIETEHFGPVDTQDAQEALVLLAAEHFYRECDGYECMWPQAFRLHTEEYGEPLCELVVDCKKTVEFSARTRG
jgi:hypothetical protein